MKYIAEVKYQLTPDRCYRRFLRLRAQDDTRNFEVQEGSGAFIHFVNMLRKADWETALEKAESYLGSFQQIQTIELD